MTRDVLQVTTLVQVGDRLALMIEKEWLDRFGIASDTPREIATHGESLVLQPVGNEHRARILEAARLVMESPRRDIEEIGSASPEFLDLKDVLLMHELEIQRFGGFLGLQNRSLLD